MKKLYFLMAVLTAFVLVAPTLAHAQKFEITPYAGYRWTSQINGTTITLPDGTTLSNLDFESGMLYGLWLDARVQPRLMLELVLEGMPTKIQGTDDTTGKKTDAYDFNLYYFQLGLLYEIIEAGIAAEQVKVRPFIMGALGMTMFDPAGDRATNSRFSASFAMGFKTMFSQRLGLRVQGRYMWTYMSAGNDYFCTGTGTGVGEQCTLFPTTESLSQIDLTLGLIIAF